MAVGLVAVINIMAQTIVPDAVDIVPLIQPDNALPRPDNPPLPGIGISRDEASLLIDQTLNLVQTISLISLFAIIILGSIVAYQMVGAALKPVSNLSQIVTHIDAGALDQRVSLPGPADEIKQLADEFDAMLDRLDQAFRQQSRFVADTAHELRTPLAVMRTNIEVVQMDQKAALADYQETITVLKEMLDRLEQMVNSLLLLARQEYEMAQDEVSLLLLLEEVVADLTPLATKRRIILRLNGDKDPVVQGDSILLASAFSNLVENGIRYNRPGGFVEITVGEELNWAVISIADNGLGIPADQQNHIFDRFYRLDFSRSRQTGGTGLGLSIVSHIVQLHNGHINLQSSHDTGSTFTLYLPVT
ncbi:MAG: ATP-binding protein [Chloroflexi bacterium]|nr:ATP-binding protein [Chloroflexota bacterium]